MKRLIISIFASGLIIPVAAQDIHFSQFNETPMHVNPSYTGVFNGVYRAMVNYRSQWASMGYPYTTMAASFDLPIPTASPVSIGAGAFIYQDKAGDSKFGTFQAQLAASAIVPLDRNSKICAGLQGGFAQRSATISSLQWESQFQNGTYDPTLPSNEGNMLTSFPYVDFASGVSYHYQSAAENLQGKDIWKLSTGFAYFHLNRPTMKYYGGSSKMYGRMVGNVNAHYDFPGTKWSIQPSALFMQQGPAKEITFGSMMRYRMKNGTKVTSLLMESGVALGVHYRVGDAVIPQLYYDLGDWFLGLSYDVNVSSYAEASKAKGGFEVTLRYANMNSALFKNRRPIR